MPPHTLRPRVSLEAESSRLFACAGPQSHAMEELLKHLLVRGPNGTLTPASSPPERIIHIEAVQSPRCFHTTLTPKAQVLQAPMDKDAISIDSKVDFTPPPSAQPSYRFFDLPNLMSIDDFEKENPFTPKQTLVQIKPTKLVAESVVRVHNFWTSQGITADFEYERNAQVIMSVTLSFLDEMLKADGPFASKRHAKEEVCKLALPRMEALDKQSNAKKRKSTEALEAAHSRISPALLKSENFVGLLQGEW